MSKNIPKMISFYPQGQRTLEGRKNRMDFYVDEETGEARYVGHKSAMTPVQRKDLFSQIKNSGGDLVESDSHRRLIEANRDDVMSLLVRNELKP